MTKKNYILNIVWALKLNHNKESRHVHPITESQTVQAQKSADMLGHKTNSKFCLRNTAMPVVRQTVQAPTCTDIVEHETNS